MIRFDTTALRWLASYFGQARGAWAAAGIATIVASATEPLLPALIKPLLDRGFRPGGIALWMVPAAVLLLLLLLFMVRGTTGFLADLALAKITQDSLLNLRGGMFARLLARCRSGIIQKNAALPCGRQRGEIHAASEKFALLSP